MIILVRHGLKSFKINFLAMGDIEKIINKISPATELTDRPILRAQPFFGLVKHLPLLTKKILDALFLSLPLNFSQNQSKDMKIPIR